MTRRLETAAIVALVVVGVLFKEAKDRAPRARYVAQQQAQQQELEKA